ncbi:ATP-binding protein [Thermodesulfobacteriota bacterium]
MNMWKKVSLHGRIFIILAFLMVITLLGGIVMLWYTYQMEGLFTQIIDKNMAAFETAEALELALVNQKGFVSYYFLDKDPDWLRQLGEYRQIFKEKLNRARALIETEKQRQAIDLIEAQYLQYIRSKDQVIAYYQKGEQEVGSQLHKEVRNYFFNILELCEEYKKLHRQKIEQARKHSNTQARQLRITAVTAMALAFFLGILLVFVLLNHILGPLRKLALEADRSHEANESEDEVKALSRSIHGLMEDVDQTHSELERSREHLLQAEKMAMVGKLAAGVAHSVRNPLTSVSMRLFSLGRTLDLGRDQKEDFDVISEEIRHIDTIVQNFLEFSRPPKLKMQRVNPSEVVDLVLQLLRHRLESYDVGIKVDRMQPLSSIEADPEQLKEVLVNLIENACESMDGGGSIIIHEEEDTREPMGKVVVIRVSDNGSGIPEHIQDKVLQPFFTTKEEGTGLGMSIAVRIIEEHGGNLDFISTEGEGTIFVVTLPVKE